MPRAWFSGGPVAVAALVMSCLAAHVATAADVPVPFDSAGKILQIDAPLADQLGLFRADHPGFLEARLYALPDSTFTLEIMRRVGRSEVRDRLSLDRAQLDSLRAEVRQRIIERKPTAQYSREAESLLRASGALLGFGFYGWAVPDLLNLEGENYAGAYILTTAASILLPNLATRGRDITYPAVTLGLYGATRGIAHGAMIAHLGDNPSDDAVLGAALGTSLAEGVLGYAWGARLTPGQVGIITTMGDVGMGYGGGIADLSSESSNTATAGALIGSAAGVACGRLIGSVRDYSYGDASIMRSGGAVGGYLGFAVAEQAENASHDSRVLGTLVGSAAGLVIGDRLVNGAGYSFGQSIGVQFVTLAGGLLALGATLLTSPGDDSEGLIAATTSIGAAAGYALGVATQVPGGRPQPAMSMGFDLRPVSLPGPDKFAVVPRVTATLAF